MRNLKSLQIYKIAAFMALLVIFNASCKKDDPVLPNYAGIWVTSGYYPIDANDSLLKKDNMTFTEKTFSFLMQVKLPNGQYVDVSNLKGTMTVNGNIMNYTANEFSVSSRDPITKLPTGQLITYKSGDTMFDKYYGVSGKPITHQSEYNISGNQLTLKSDNNADGDYLDENEITVYSKQ